MKITGAGERIHRITILKRTAQISNLDTNPIYTPTQTRWGKIDPLSARELLQVQSSDILSQATHKITMLWTPEIKHDDQLKYNGRVFEIVGQPMNREERNREMIIMVCERH